MAIISTKRVLVVGFIAVIGYCLLKRSQLPQHIGGSVDPRFQRVKNVFESNFKEGWERDGASLAVYERGKKVVDLWGGYSDKESNRKWQEDTVGVIFSTSKGVSSICLGILVDRGFLSYDDLVTKHWPEFGENGKDNVTVMMLVSHQAGLAYFDSEVTLDEAHDHKLMSKKIEKQRPNWPPGTMAAYHALNHGWLVDQLVRRVDPKHRGIGQFVREELHDKLDIDIHFGLPKEEAPRVTRLYETETADMLYEVFTDSDKIKKFIDTIKHVLTEEPIMSKIVQNLPWMGTSPKSLNNPDFWQLEQAGALGIGNGRSLAKLYDLVVRKQLISSKTLSFMQKYQSDVQFFGKDLAMPIGAGLFMSNLGGFGGSHFKYGHAGNGCQQALMDVENELAIGYTTNGLKMLLIESCGTFDRLKAAIYESISKH